jgi:hypothetical protein
MSLVVPIVIVFSGILISGLQGFNHYRLKARQVERTAAARGEQLSEQERETIQKYRLLGEQSLKLIALGSFAMFIFLLLESGRS